jgi:hypothetical protein
MPYLMYYPFEMFLGYLHPRQIQKNLPVSISKKAFFNHAYRFQFDGLAPVEAHTSTGYFRERHDGFTAY